MRLLVAFIALLCPHLIFGKQFVKPETDGRSYFAVAMANALEEHQKAYTQKETSYTISPAAVQKMLAIIYNAVEDGNDLLDIMLLEMGLKYLDEARLMERAIKEMTLFDVLKEEQLDKLDKPIKRDDVLNYFQTDFNELGEQIGYENYLIAPLSAGFKSDFKSFAKTFFNATLAYDDNNNKEALAKVYEKFELAPTKLNSKSMELFSVLSLEANWKPLFVLSNDVLETRGEFSYSEITSLEDHHLSVQVLELHLESKIDLSVLLVTPKHGVELNFTTSYAVVRTVTDPDSSLDVLKPHHMNIKLPNIFQFQTKTDLMPYFGKNGLTNAGIFHKEQPLCRMFSYKSCLGMPNSIHQLVNIKIEAHTVKELPTHRGGFLQSVKNKIVDFTQTKTFDITQKPFLFIIKSKQVIYFMGHYYGKNLK